MKSIKKLFIFLLTIIFCISIPMSVLADNSTTTDTEIQYYDDGSYLVIVTEESISPFSSGTKSKSKTGYFYENEDELQWSVTLTATFSYTGSSARCTDTDTSYKIYDSAWKITETKVGKAGNKATAIFTAKKYWIGIITSTRTLTLTLTCDNNGNIS